MLLRVLASEYLCIKNHKKTHFFLYLLTHLDKLISPSLKSLTISCKRSSSLSLYTLKRRVKLFAVFDTSFRLYCCRNKWYYPLQLPVCSCSLLCINTGITMQHKPENWVCQQKDVAEMLGQAAKLTTTLVHIRLSCTCHMQRVHTHTELLKPTHNIEQLNHKLEGKGHTTNTFC